MEYIWDRSAEFSLSSWKCLKAFTQSCEWWIIFNPSTVFHRRCNASLSLSHCYFHCKCSNDLKVLVIRVQANNSPCHVHGSDSSSFISYSIDKEEYSRRQLILQEPPIICTFFIYAFKTTSFRNILHRGVLGPRIRWEIVLKISELIYGNEY